MPTCFLSEGIELDELPQESICYRRNYDDNDNFRECAYPLLNIFLDCTIVKKLKIR